MVLQKTVYAYHPETGEYIGPTLADLSPLDEGEVWLIPAYATELKPPGKEKRKASVFRLGEWAVVDDFRAVRLWSKGGACQVVAQIGDTPESLGATELEPPPFAVWSGDGWLVDSKAEQAAKAAAVDAEAAALRVIADAAVVPLEDAQELEMATAAELEALRGWKRYRVLLSRVAQQSGYPQSVEWPAVPAAIENK
ncbi:tail fiber assembly protein [Chromobacterium haemolyticum]|uniref:Tail fiber assembly protein n=1 Tax=Chromobacterium fluminis TaxID=3044269 RepID=A0ABX0LLF1_9NEIS|nr:tail fiber assembly protein [Chromobacterium haemolyticum]NHR07997.1 tail fiber assembly protein [Chromobacterium haemolyticum]